MILGAAPRPTDHAEVMPVRINQEGSVIVGRILRSISRRAIVDPAKSEPDRVKVPDRPRIGSGEAHVKPVARSDWLRTVVRCVHHEELGGRGAITNEIGLLEAAYRANRRQ